VRGDDEVVILERRIPAATIGKALALAVMASGLVLGVTLLMLMVDGHPLVPTFFEVVSAFGTVGLTLGITPQLSPAGKLLIIATMYAGRVGPLTLAVALARRGRRPVLVRYPAGRVLVG
ncbi:MAG TPA: potassium transporter TrkG, partial [Thermaerobacter sp.]